MKKEKDYGVKKKEVLTGFWRSISGEEEGGSHGGLRIQQDYQNQQDKERKECKSCTYAKGPGGYDKKML